MAGSTCAIPFVRTPTALYILDRWKDMYIFGGENVYPAEVENVLYQLDRIGEVAVIGVPDERWGEVGCAVIVVKPGEQLTADEVLRHCRADLATFKVPASIEFMDELPHNASPMSPVDTSASPSSTMRRSRLFLER